MCSLATCDSIEPEMLMFEPTQDRCGKCGAEIDASRRVDFTLKDGTRVCESCFVKETASPARLDKASS